jgi:hypothetical protein
MLPDATTGAMDRGRGEVPGAVHSDKQIVVERMVGP